MGRCNHPLTKTAHEPTKQQPADERRLKEYMASTASVFKTTTHNKLPFALQYTKGLFQSPKGNIERMVERVLDSEYYSIRHFISESPWSARAGFDKVAADTSTLFESCERVALLVDESAHPKKGNSSVGVARQYCGTTGKIDLA